jgi:hypothetical protein
VWELPDDQKLMGRRHTAAWQTVGVSARQKKLSNPPSSGAVYSSVTSKQTVLAKKKPSKQTTELSEAGKHP